MQEALQALLGAEAKGLSASTVMRLKAGWAGGVPDISAKLAGGSELGLPVCGRHLQSGAWRGKRATLHPRGDRCR